MDLTSAFDSIVLNPLDRRILVALFEARRAPRLDDVRAAADRPPEALFNAALDRLGALGLAHRARALAGKGKSAPGTAGSRSGEDANATQTSVEVLAITSAGVAIAQVVIGVMADGADLDKVVIGKERPASVDHYLIRP
ncbi:MAG: hypothetical protein ACYDCK_08180 [Thermoplasmatota archaeon]